MKRLVLSLAVLATSAVLATTARPAGAIDLTGTWAGKLSCKGIENGSREQFTCCEVIQITQIGNSINVREGGLLYFGRVLTLDASPTKGSATFVGCVTDNTLGNDAEMVFANVTDDGVKATLKGRGPYNEDPTDQFLCTWNYKRIDTADPGVPGC
jgi:hypothetical protein